MALTSFRSALARTIQTIIGEQCTNVAKQEDIILNITYDVRDARDIRFWRLFASSMNLPLAEVYPIISDPPIVLTPTP